MRGAFVTTIAVFLLVVFGAGIYAAENVGIVRLVAPVYFAMLGCFAFLGAIGLFLLVAIRDAVDELRGIREELSKKGPIDRIVQQYPAATRVGGWDADPAKTLR